MHFHLALYEFHKLVEKYLAKEDKENKPPIRIMNIRRKGRGYQGRNGKTGPKVSNELFVLNTLYKKGEPKMKLVKGEGSLDKVRTVGGEINVNAELTPKEKE